MVVGFVGSASVVGSFVVGSIVVGLIVVDSIVVRCIGIFNDSLDVSVINCGVVGVVFSSVVSSKSFVVMMVETTGLVEVDSSVMEEFKSVVVSITALSLVEEASVADIVATVLSKAEAVVSDVTLFFIGTVLSVVELVLVVSWSVT